MPDIELRMHTDMLVLSSTLDATLERQGVDVAADRQYLNLMEPETLEDALRLQKTAGAQCLVAATEDITPARLAHLRMEASGPQLAAAALEVVNSLRPQHALVEIGPCGLPLDSSSKASLVENRDQYARAAAFFEGLSFDAFFLNGFTSLADLKCALMGVAKSSGKTVFASIDVAPQTPSDEDVAPRTADGKDSLEEAFATMAELGAGVVGFQTGAPMEQATQCANIAWKACNLPVLAQLAVGEVAPHQEAPTEENPYYLPDAMVKPAAHLYAAGVQFLRATGNATAAYTGALAATVMGLDVRRNEGARS